MDQPPRLAPDLAALLLCCGNTALETLARPLRRLMPTFASHPVVQHFGPRLSHCPHLVAGFIERYVAEELERPYGDPQADLAAATLSRNGMTLKDGVSLPEIESAVIDLHAAQEPRDDQEVLALALARLRRPFVKRARRAHLPLASTPLFLRQEKTPVASEQGWIAPDNLWGLIENRLGEMPFLKEFFNKVVDEQQRIGKVNILIAGKTGVGKSTLVNAIFGQHVAPTGAGRPVTEEIHWYEPLGIPVRLCDTKGLELANFESILADVEGEIGRGARTGKVEERVHILWLCISEPGARVEEGERRLATICEKHHIPIIVVLAKAIGPRSFGETVRTLLPEAKTVIRVLAEDWEGDPPRPKFGLADLVRATHDLLPEATQNAFDAAQRIVMERKRPRALTAVRTAAATAAMAAATPLPVADAAGVLAVNIGMIASVSVLMGVQMSSANIRTIAGSILGAMAVTGGWRLMAGELLKFIPGIGSVAGGVITSAIAASSTYGLGYAYIEFLCRFHASEQRMPDGDELRNGFRRFWEIWEHKEMKPTAPEKPIPY